MCLGGWSMPIILIILALVVAAPNASAQLGTRFLALPFLCDANAGGTFRPTEPTVHQILNYKPGRTLSACVNGHAAFNDEEVAPRNVDCRPLTVFSFDIVCRGGIIMSVPQVAVRHQERFRYALSGQSLVMVFTPTYPASDRVIGRAVLPAGWGPLPLNPRLLDNPSAAPPNIPLLMARQVRVSGSPPGPLEHIRSVFRDAAPVPQLILAGLMLPSIVLAFIGAFHNPQGFMHPARWEFWLWLLLIGVGLWSSTTDPNIEAAATHRRATEAVRKIEVDQARLHQLIQIRNGYIEPLTVRASGELDGLLALHTIPDTNDLGQSSRAFNTGVIGFILVFLVSISSYTYAGFYYLFRKPAVVGIVGPALAAGDPVPHQQSLAAIRAAGNMPDLAAADDSDFRHLSHLADALADDVGRRGQVPGDAPVPPSIASLPQDRSIRRWRLLRYIMALIDRRDRSLAAELDAARHQKSAKQRS